jgi:hypothetical protein
MMDHVTYWALLAGIVLLAIAWWGWKNMRPADQKAATAGGALEALGLA